MIIVNDDSRVFIKLEASLTADARVVIYDSRMFIVPLVADLQSIIKIISIIKQVASFKSSLLLKNDLQNTQTLQLN